MDTNLHPPISHEHQRSYSVQFLRQRVRELYRDGRDLAQQHLVLRTAFAELSTALDLLQARDKEYLQQQQQWLNEREELEADIQRYQEFFTMAPLPYMVTSLEGTIRQANTAATALFGAPEKLLVGRSLALFVPEGQRRVFRTNLLALQDAKDVQTWDICLHPWEGTPFEVELAAVVNRSHNGKPQNVRWQFHDISARKYMEQQFQQRIAHLEQHGADGAA